MKSLKKQITLSCFFIICYFYITGLVLSCAPPNPNNAPRIYSSTSPNNQRPTNNEDRTNKNNEDETDDEENDDEDTKDRDRDRGGNENVNQEEEFVSEMPEEGSSPITRDLW